MKPLKRALEDYAQQFTEDHDDGIYFDGDGKPLWFCPEESTPCADWNAVEVEAGQSVANECLTLDTLDAMWERWLKWCNDKDALDCAWIDDELSECGSRSRTVFARKRRTK